MIRWLYEKRLLAGLSTLPSHICFMITAHDMEDDPDKIVSVSRWCVEITDAVRESPGRGEKAQGIDGVTFHISTVDAGENPSYIGNVRKIGEFARLTLHLGDSEETIGQGMNVHVAVGKSGREEITECIRQMARDGLSPNDVTEHAIEERLKFRYTPELVIKTGDSHLTDFLIWQSVYSELFFSDVNWALLRKIDFLRALRDYQSRIRRFGR